MFAVTLGFSSPLWADVRGDTVEILEQQFPLVIESPQRWDAEDLRSFLRGASAMPDEVWQEVRKGTDGPIAVEFVSESCLFSVGRYNESCPTFKDGDRRHFFVYEPAQISGEGPVERLKLLNQDEQRDLQLRRAAVHLAMVHLDEHLEWSDNWDWRAINGWSSGGDQPRNRDPLGYSRYLGMHSAHLDLVTFAEEFFVRVEDLLLEKAGDDEQASQRLATIAADDTLVCTQFTRRRVFNNRMDELVDAWSEPERPIGDVGGDGAEPVCPDFEEWAGLDGIESFDIWYADGADDRLESFFGYLILHVRYDDEHRQGRETLDTVYQFGAVADEEMDVFAYVIQGILGGLPAVLEGEQEEVDQDFGLRRYELMLSDEQRRRFLERLWEAKRQVRYPYLFLTRNYASLILDLLEPVLDEPFHHRRRTMVTTPDVLETLSRQSNAEFDSMLRKYPSDESSDRSDNPRSMGPAGRNRLSLGGGWMPEQQWGTGRMSYSLIEDRIGETRRRGFRANLGFRFLGLEATVPFDDRAYRNMQIDLVVLRYETIQRPTSADRSGFRDRFGWGIDGRIVHDGRRELWSSVQLTPFFLLPLWTGTDDVAHLIAKAGPAVRVDVHSDQDPLGGGVAGLLGQLHLFGNYANVLRFGATTGHYTGLSLQWDFDLRATAELRLAPFSRNEHPFVLAPYIEGLWTSRDYRDDAPEEGFQSWEAGVLFELPF